MLLILFFAAMSQWLSAGANGTLSITSVEQILKIGEAIREKTCRSSLESDVQECETLKKGLKNLDRKEVQKSLASLLETSPCISDTESFAKNIVTAVGTFGKGPHSLALFELIDCIEKNKATWQTQCPSYIASHNSKNISEAYSPRQPVCTYEKEPVTVTLDSTCKLLVLSLISKHPDEGSSKSAHKSYIYGTWKDLCLLKFHKPYETLSIQKQEGMDTEISILNALKQTPVVGLPKVLHADRKRFLVERFDNDLWKYIDRKAKPPSENVAIQAGAHLLAGLRALHDMGIVHADLKPGNVSLLNASDVRSVRGAVLDFDLSYDPKKECEDGKPRPRVGTTGWMAPEYEDWADEKNCEKSAHLAKKGDVYVMGSVLYSLFHKKDPKWIQECWRKDPSCINKFREKLQKSKDPFDTLIAKALDPNVNTRIDSEEFQRLYDREVKATKFSKLPGFNPDLNKNNAPEVVRSPSQFVTYVTTAPETGLYEGHIVYRKNGILVDEILQSHPFETSKMFLEIKKIGIKNNLTPVGLKNQAPVSKPDSGPSQQKVPTVNWLKPEPPEPGVKKAFNPLYQGD